MTTITIDGPGKNALGTARLRDLHAQLDAAGTAPLLVTGTGDAFSAGLDLKEVHGADLATMRTFLTLLTSLLERLYTHPAPTVAAINGHAIAGGCLVGLVCDHRVLTTNPRARVGLNEVALGLRFPPRILAMARTCVPAHHHLEILLGAELHTPEAALRLGLADALHDDPLALATAYLERLASHPADAYAAGKALLRDLPADPEEDRLFEEQVLPVWVGDAVKARVSRFLK